MQKLIVLAAGMAAAGSAALFGAGVATADVVGSTYSDAVSEIEGSGGSPVVASTVGGRLPQDECIVTNSWNAPFFRNGGHSSGEVMLSLNCNGGHASATNPGASVASPAGRESKLAADLAAQEEEQALQTVSTPDE